MATTLKNNIKHLIPITRVEFIPANSASVLIGFAWAIESNYSFDLNTIGLLLSLFVVLSAVGTLGAHWNSYSDHELDSADPTKVELHKNMLDLGKRNLIKIIRIEVVLATAIFSIFFFKSLDWRLLGIWIVAIFLAFAYSMPPIRLKAKGPLAFISLCLVLSILPILFVYLTINQSLCKKFILFLLGHTMVVYSLIIPTEIRDYAVDKSHQVSTMTVWLGMKKAIAFAQILIVIGTCLIIINYYRTELFIEYPFPSISLLIIIVCNGYVFVKFYQLRKLINSSASIDEPINQVSNFAKDNPKWITISSVGSMVVGFVTAIGKIFA